MNQLLQAIPYAGLLGVSVEMRGDEPIFLLPFRDEIIGNPTLPAIHGGVLGAFLELAALVRLIHDAAPDKLPKPINFSVDYLRSAGPKDCRARAEIYKLGRRIANVKVVAWQDDENKPVVAGNGKFLF